MNSKNILSTADFLMACANACIFPKASFRPQVFEELSIASMMRDYFEKRAYRIRHPVPEDLCALVELEAACWPDPLRVPAQELQTRIERYPFGHCVVEVGRRLVGGIYSQRIAAIEPLQRIDCASVAALHREDGPFVQLLAVNVLPEMQNLGLGDQLLEFMLQYGSARTGVKHIVAVSLCKAYHLHPAIPMETYIYARDDAGYLLDPMLRFHEAHGGRIAGLCPGYRPKDTDNRGNGVLIEYDIARRRPENAGTTAPAAATQAGPRWQGPLLSLVEACMRQVMGPAESGSFSSSRPLMEMGFDSLKLMELRSLLGRRLGRELDSAFFFRHGTPEKIVRFFEKGGPGEAEDAATHVERPLRPSARAVRQTAPVIQSMAAGRQVADQAVAVVGMACRFPGHSENPADFWNLLARGADAVSEIPPERWDMARYYDPDPQKSGRIISRHGGFIRHVDRFDAQFFNISPREAAAMDPQQRLLLTLSWEALEHAGIDPAALGGTRGGVFVGMFSHDYETLQLKGNDCDADPVFDDTYFATGNSAAVAAGRIAYCFGFEGPALTVDTACSSSLVAVHLACRSLRGGESDIALAAGVNLMLSPELSMTFSRAGMLSPTGRCKSFDAAADGYVRGEGCAVVVLKLLSRALADGDPVLAVVRGSAINQDGASNGLTAPNGLAQEAVIRAALDDAGVAPREVSYIEAHGTGTALGDPVEVGALANVYKAGRRADHPLFIGSVKANIGHTEAAAGIAGLIKVILALQHRRIPQQVHFTQLNPQIPLAGIPATIPVAGTDWPAHGPGNRRLAGVSSFGFSGTNAHVVVEEAPEAPCPVTTNLAQRPLHILTLSAKSEAARRGLAERYALFLDSPAARDRLADICHTANTGRTHFNHRTAVVAASATEMADKLRSAGGAAQGIYRGSALSPPRIAFLFTGQGAQFAGMGQTLYETQPTFRQALERCAVLLQTVLDRPLLDVLYPACESDRGWVDQTVYTQPALFALEYALCCLWRRWGVQPDAVIGHSVGEYAAACAAGVFSLEDGLKLIAARARLMQALPGDGAMAAVFARAQQVKDAIAPFGDALSLAALNGPRLTVISGRATTLAQVTRALSAQSIQVTMLNVSHAFHSPLMAPVLEPFGKVAREIRYARPRIELISNLSGDVIGEQIASPDYWVTHIRETVRFAGGIETLYRKGYRVFVEIGPHPVLAGMARMCLPNQDQASDRPCVWLPSLLRGKPDWQQMLAGLAELYSHGAKIDWQGFDADDIRSKMAGLPTYAFEDRRYWLKKTPGAGSKARTDGARQKKTSGHGMEEKDNLLYRLVWRQEPTRDQAQANRLPSPAAVRHGIAPLAGDAMPAFPDLLARMESLCAVYVQDALSRLGWDFPVGSRFTSADAAGALGVADKYQALLERLLGMLAEEEVLRRDARGWEVLQACRMGRVDECWRTLCAQYEPAEAELTLLGRCAAGLAGVLRGECDPLGLVFPEGDLTTAVRLYEDSPTFGAMNRLTAQALAAIVAETTGGRKLRILEIGAGTGGTTAAVLPHLVGAWAGACAGDRVEYIFTDISAHFLAKARERFANYPFVRYQRLDIEKETLEQGFRPHAVDVILAANVLHATEDLRHTLKQVGQLLAPGGLLVLLEGTAQRRWLDMIFGLLDGWWRFKDHDLRPAHPLMGTAAWEALLRDSGFGETAVMAPGQGEALFEQALIVARRLPDAQPATVCQARHWLICADAAGVGARLSALLVAHGDRVTTALAGPRFAGTTDGACTVDPGERDDLGRLLRAAREGQPALHGIIHLWGLDAPQPAACADHDAGAASVDLCTGLLHLVQAVAEPGGAPPPALWLVTRHAVCANGAEQLLPGLYQAPLLGLAQVINAEHPELRCVRIDMDHGPGSVKALFHEIVHAGPADLIALRDNARYAARLAPLPVDAASARPPTDVIHAGGAYLISGGLGGIGLQIASRMAARGAGKIILIGRHGTPPAGSPAAAALSELAQAGADVVVMPADVSRKGDVQAVLERVATFGMPLKGIVHAAGVFEDRLLTNHAREFFKTVFAAKVGGAWHLHQLTRDMPLDFFVLCASATTFVCSSGLGNYVAANAFLDALAHYRRSIGLPAVSIGWGPWRATGMAGAVGRKRLAQWAAQGLGMLTPEEALAVFQQMLVSGEPQVAAMRMDWQLFFEQQAGSAPPAFFEPVARHPQTARPAIHADFYRRLKAAPADRRPQMLREHLRLVVAAVLGLPSAGAVDIHQGFFQMGMDSLTSMALRNRLQLEFACPLGATMIFKYPSVAALAQFLLAALFGPEVGAAGPDPVQSEPMGAGRPAADETIPGTAAKMIHAALDDITEKEAEALLLERLDDLRY